MSSETEELRAALQTAKTKLVEQDALLKKLTALPLLIATLVGLNKDSAIVIADGKLLKVEAPTAKIPLGSQVLLNPQTMQIVSTTPAIRTGNISIVRRVINETRSEVDMDGGIRVVLNGNLSGRLEVGDWVVLDPSATIISLNLGKQDESFSLNSEMNVSWDDIGGLVEAKKQMIETIEFPFRHPDVYRFYNKKPVKGILLYGPPGCGKTMLGKAVATAIAKLHKAKSKASGFIYIKGPEILDKYVGVSEATIRSIFQSSRKHKQKHGYPAIIFIDEADAILGKRGMGISSDIERTIVPAFLAEMDGLEETGAIVLLATNRADILDPAVTRDGRIDRKIKVGRPDENTAKEIFQLYLKSVPLCNGYTVDDLSKEATLELYSDKYAMYGIKTKKETKKFSLKNLVNGAMIAGVVDQATSFSLHRDLQSNSKPAGMSKEDLMASIQQIFQQNLDLNHHDDLEEFIHDYRNEVVKIERITEQQ